MSDPFKSFRIGATSSGSSHSNNWNGLIDEVRISEGVLEESQLLVIPEPGTLLLMGLGFASLLLTKRIRK